ncbi:MAG: zf-HC2 domain-containing protein [Candidatus Aminicenantes bacterium]|nr:MAG: zf-HC2 domain-containing protein [Candidatus Aminicenantes bacterium]
MDCSEFHELLDTYLEDSLEEDQWLLFRRHLRDCTSCGDWAQGVEPSLLFTTAESGPVDLARIEACAVAVTGQIRQERLAGKLLRHRRPWLAAAAAAAAVALVGAGAWRLMPVGGDVVPAMSFAVGESSETGAAPPTVEVEMNGDDVRVYQFASEEDTDTAVYFIVNPAMKL